MRQYIYPHGLAADAPGQVHPQAQRPVMQMGPMAQPTSAEDQGLVNALYDIFGNYPRMNVLPYFYAFRLVGTNAIAANSTSRASIKVSADASFVANYFTGTADGEYEIFMRTDSSDRQLMDIAIHSAALVGTAERPLILPKPLRMDPNTTISFELTDLTGQENEVYFTMVGFKVYRRQYAVSG